jgi:1,4-dihydroxy-2-naphthoate octaprenyltransferase
MIVYTAITGAAALAIGGHLDVLRGEIVGMLLAAGAFFVLVYTFPLKYIGLGEPAVLAFWGPRMVGGGYYVITGEWSNNVAVASIAYALRTMPVLLGEHAAPSLRRVYETYKNPGPKEAPPELPKGVWPLYFVAITFWYNRRFGMLFLIGLVSDIILSRI